MLLPSTALAAEVKLVTAGSDEETRALVLVVRDLLRRLDATVSAESAASIDPRSIIERPGTFEPAFARVWIDLRPADHGTLYLVDGEWERVLVRRVKRDPEHLEVAREELGHILETAIEAMLAGARIGLDRASLLPEPKPEPKPPPERTTPPAPLPPETLELRAGVFEQVFAFSSAMPVVHALGLSAAIEQRHGIHAGGWLTAAYRFPASTHATPIGVRLQGLETRLLVRVALLDVRPVRLDAAIGFGLDAIVVEPIANRAGVGLARKGVDASFLVRLAVLARFWKTLGVAFVIDAEPTVRDYPLSENGRTVVALAPFPVRPGVLIEASF